MTGCVIYGSYNVRYGKGSGNIIIGEGQEAMEENRQAVIYLPGGEVFTNIVCSGEERPYRYYRYLAKADAMRFTAKAGNWKLKNLHHDLVLAPRVKHLEPEQYKITVFHATDEELTYIADREIRRYFSKNENIERLCRFTTCLCEWVRYETFDITASIEEDIGMAYTITGDQVTGVPEKIKAVTIDIGVEWIDDMNYSLYMEWME